MPAPAKRWLGLLGWTATWLLLWFCDGVLNLGNLALLLVLGSAMAGIWFSPAASLVACVCSVMIFNWLFVPPRFTFNVDLNQDLLLLVTMLCVSAIVSYSMSRLRLAAQLENEHAADSERMRRLSEQFRDSHNLHRQAEWLQAGLQQQTPANISVLLKPEGHQTEGLETSVGLDVSDKQLNEGLRNCIKEFAPLGPGTGRFENQRTLFLPIRGRTKAFGAVAIRGLQLANLSQAKHGYLQQMCDLLGLEIERDLTLKQIQQSKEEAQNQSIRNTLLTSISHDYRTPLANLIGAASVIHTQNNRLNTEQVTELAQTVLLEAQHLNRMTSNTLQLARLDAAPWKVHKDWESLQEIIGSVLAKTRFRYPQRDIQVSMYEALPLVFCDAMLLVQLFDNLMENAIKYSPLDSRIDIEVNTFQSELQVRVTDRGTGIPDQWKERVFQAFERMQDESAQADASDESQLRRGVGVGLAVCKAIAKVHEARIWVEDTQPQGATVCIAFAIEQQPDMSASLPEV
jgi:two-component system sensor histidine kinase KdpD